MKIANIGKVNGVQDLWAKRKKYIWEIIIYGALFMAVTACCFLNSPLMYHDPGTVSALEHGFIFLWTLPFVLVLAVGTLVSVAKFAECNRELRKRGQR